MRLGKALATGIAEEAPQEAVEVAADREVSQDQRQSTGAADVPEPLEVPAVR
ncbi:hypothetical protein ABII15_09440 [Streptomyces sp. HUAS MG91]|uniref:Uncharacterized protein n=1 Tax=Streptomyces tabacisoli TaxID=3156398 RepID=A0AAU8IPL2_9ACTN